MQVEYPELETALKESIVHWQSIIQILKNSIGCNYKYVVSIRNISRGKSYKIIIYNHIGTIEFDFGSVACSVCNLRQLNNIGCEGCILYRVCIREWKKFKDEIASSKFVNALIVKKANKVLKKIKWIDRMFRIKNWIVEMLE